MLFILTRTLLTVAIIVAILAIMFVLYMLIWEIGDMLWYAKNYWFVAYKERRRAKRQYKDFMRRNKW